MQDESLEMCGMVMSELNMPAVPVFSDDQFCGVVSLVVPVTRGVQRALTPAAGYQQVHLGGHRRRQRHFREEYIATTGRCVRWLIYLNSKHHPLISRTLNS